MGGARLEAKGSPRGLLRLLVRAPILLYRARLGFLLGRRFLMLEHTGRSSGKRRRTVLEVAANMDTAVFVVAAWGEGADWLRNVRADPRVTVHWGPERFDTVAGDVDPVTARRVLDDYAARHPGAFRRLARLILSNPSPETAENVARMVETLPVVEFPLP